MNVREAGRKGGQAKTKRQALARKRNMSDFWKRVRAGEIERPGKKRLIRIWGMTKSASEWAKEFHQPFHRFCNRIDQLGWSPAKALTTPPQQISRNGARKRRHATARTKS